MDLCNYGKKVQRYSLLNLEEKKKTLEITCPFIGYLLYKLWYMQLLKQMWLICAGVENAQTLFD